MPLAPMTRSRTRKIVVSAAPTSTTDMTGLFRNVIGLSFPTDAQVARFTISGSKSGRARTSFLGRSDVGSTGASGSLGLAGDGMVTVGMVRLRVSEKPSAVHHVVLDDRAQGKHGKERQRSYDQNGADEQTDEERAMRGKRSARE